MNTNPDGVSAMSAELGVPPEREAYERAYNAGFVEASRIHGAEIERLRELLMELWRAQDPDKWNDEFAAEVSAACKA